LRQQALASRLGEQRASVSQWEIPERALPSIGNQVLIALETGVSYDWLATGRGIPQLPAEGEVSAVTLGSFASTQQEEDLLAAFRGLGRREREAVLTITESMLRRGTARV
jgi:transcriptional regulator with XRE-family HTH domain